MLDQPPNPRSNLNVGCENVSEFLIAHCIEQALIVAAKIRLGDALDGQPTSAEELARRTQTDSGALLPLLRILASLGVIVETPSMEFVNVISSPLEQLRARSLYVGDAEMWSVWGAAEGAIRSGVSAVEALYGLSFYELLEARPELASNFHGYLLELCRTDVESITEAIDLSTAKVVVEVGGGSCALLAHLLAVNPVLRGIALELPAAAVLARRVVPDAIVDRITFVEGDARQTVPGDGDVYLMKSVLCDWNDTNCLRILQNLAAAMRPESALVLVERLSEPRGQSLYEQAMDLQSVLLFGGGGLRSEAHISNLLDHAGLQIVRQVATKEFSIIEARLCEPDGRKPAHSVESGNPRQVP